MLLRAFVVVGLSYSFWSFVPSHNLGDAILMSIIGFADSFFHFGFGFGIGIGIGIRIGTGIGIGIGIDIFIWTSSCPASIYLRGQLVC